MDMTTLNLGGALALGQRIVISVDGTIKVLEEGQPLQAGDVVLESQNGSNEPQVSAKRFSSEEGEIELDQDIANIFAALEEGQDPTELGEEFATAAGQNGSSLASSGTIERDGEETIPGTEFVTTGFEALGMSRTQSLSLLDAFRSIDQPNTDPTFIDNNNSPIGDTVFFSTNEDTPVSGTLSASDEDGDSLSFTKATDPSNGTVVVDENGDWTFTPNENYNGDDSFTVVVSDGQGGTDTITVNIGVTPVNDAPTLVDGNGDPLGDSVTVTTDEDTPVSGSLSASDDDGDSLSFSKGNDPSNGTVTVDENGNWTYTPNDDYNGSDSFTVIVSDGQGGADTLTVIVGVTPAVDIELSKPTIDLVDGSDTGNSDTDNLTNDTTPTFTLGDIDSDVAQEDIVVVKDGVALDGTLEKVGSTWQFTPNADLLDGTYNLSVKVTDGAGNSATSTELEITIDTDIEASITIDPITADNTVNADEADGKVVITGTVGGDVKAGDTVTLTVNGETYTGDVFANDEGDLVYSIEVDGSDLVDDEDTRVEASVTTSDDAGNEATATADATDGDYDVDTDIEASITIDPITADNTVNADEADGKVVITGTVGGDVKAG
ncbi:Ig-like domain-containing protein, partial [Vibrio sp. SG41-7]|uniref:Ig-like domain-containing protein n=1 Tax=Vibrio sp. SG41-7 TaxID=2760973 RepID=UPI001601C4FA